MRNKKMKIEDYEKIIKEQNEEAKKTIMKDRETLVQQINEAQEVCIVITENGLSIIGGYTQCKSAFISALGKMVEDNRFNEEDIKDIANLSLIFGDPSEMFKRLYGVTVEENFDGRK